MEIPDDLVVDREVFIVLICCLIKPLDRVESGGGYVVNAMG